MPECSSSSSSSTHRERYSIIDGPCWSPRMDVFEVWIARFEVLRAYTVYEIQVCVEGQVTRIERRYSQFVELHHALLRIFPLIVLPGLPGKAILARQDEGFLEGRRVQLQAYLQRLIRHPILRSCDLMTTFLVNDDYALETTLISWKARDDFVERIDYPSFNHQDGDVSKIEQDLGIIRDCADKMRNLIKVLETWQRSKSCERNEGKKFAAAVANLVNTESDPSQVEAALTLANRLKQNNLPRYDDLLARCSQWSVLGSEADRLRGVHGTILQRWNDQGDELSDQDDASLNVILSELSLLTSQAGEDVYIVIRTIQETEVDFRERLLEHMHSQPIDSLAAQRLLLRELQNNVEGTSLLSAISPF